ncbi:MAG: hypothetical protein JO236_04270 [Mycobacterium sp.]|uniref:hypothetical protein n=1 Tax=Mycobacterium sp. TaxID=1785 RepID=UPI001EBCE0E2|nr:hypothetical protein [Mycobacterium sp.]MBW0016749.1 hypothetical protein [Mycobacterium sp.]
MAIIRGFVATALFAGFAIGVASPARADLPTMNGSYNETSTSPSGRAVVTSWTVSPCGDGCVYVKAGAGGGQARLIDGQWVLDGMGDLSCGDGSYFQMATNSHVTWDPDTLAGTSTITYILPVCGQPAGYVQINQVQIKQAS